METLMEKQRKGLLKKFHTLCSKNGIDAVGKEAILSGYGVNSSRELSAHELLDICDKLDRMSNKNLAELDVWRKRVIASIFSYCKAMERDTNINVVKAIAVRAAGAKKGFNSIPLYRLRSLYSTFTKNTKDIRAVGMITISKIQDMMKYYDLNIKN